jgi:CBS domain-containing protein
MSVGRICIREVDLAEPDESVQIAAARMNSRNVGTLLVLDAASRPVGILTDRDLAIHVVAKGRDAATTTVREVMTQAPDAVDEETPIEAAISRMRAGPYRRLPVIDHDGKLVGLVSLDDILDLLSEEFAEIGRLIRREGPASLKAVEERW